MVKISELSNWAWIWWTEQVPVNDSWTTVKYTVDQILARTHNHTASQVTDFNTAVDARIDVLTDTAKTTPADTDVLALWDTVRKKVTRANIKATLKTYFDTLYHTKNALRTGLTASKMLVTDWSGNEWYADPAVMASNAEATAGTIETKYINPKQAKDNYLMLVNVVTGSKNWAWSESIAHWLGKTPKMVFAYWWSANRVWDWFYWDWQQRGKYIASSGQWYSWSYMIFTWVANDAQVTSIDSTNLNVTRTDLWEWTFYSLVFMA